MLSTRLTRSLSSKSGCRSGFKDTLSFTPQADDRAYCRNNALSRGHLYHATCISYNKRFLLVTITVLSQIAKLCGVAIAYCLPTGAAAGATSWEFDDASVEQHGRHSKIALGGVLGERCETPETDSLWFYQAVVSQL